MLLSPLLNLGSSYPIQHTLSDSVLNPGVQPCLPRVLTRGQPNADGIAVSSSLCAAFSPTLCLNGGLEDWRIQISACPGCKHVSGHSCASFLERTWDNTIPNAAKCASTTLNVYMTLVDESMPKTRRMCYSRPAPDLPSLFQLVCMPEEVTIRTCFHNALNVLASPFLSPPLNNSPTKLVYQLAAFLPCSHSEQDLTHSPTCSLILFPSGESYLSETLDVSSSHWSTGRNHGRVQ